jgi:large subunit ribosomal protein L15
VKLNEIGAPRGANRKTKRRGRGSGSGHGKTSCRGRKGAKKRSGRTTRPGFEGGQMPLVRRIPKRGFNAPSSHKAYQVVNVDSLNRFTANSVVGLKELKEAGLIGSEKMKVKILGDGSLAKVLTVKAHKISESAKKKLQEAGSKFELIP